MGCTKESRVPFRGTRLSFVRPAAGPVARRSAAAKIRIYPDRQSRPDKKSDAPRSAAQPPAHRHKSPTRIRLLPGTGTNRTADPTADPDTRASGHRGTGAPVRAQKKRDEPFSRSSRSFVGPGPDGCYIMPPMPPAGIAGTAGCSDFFSASTHSVVRNIEAIDAAFSSATRDTFVGSMIPAASMSS